MGSGGKVRCREQAGVSTTHSICPPPQRPAPQDDRKKEEMGDMSLSQSSRVLFPVHQVFNVLNNEFLVFFQLGA
jgi:hypothetical protein